MNEGIDTEFLLMNVDYVGDIMTIEVKLRKKNNHSLSEVYTVIMVYVIQWTRGPSVGATERQHLYYLFLVPSLALCMDYYVLFNPI